MNAECGIHGQMQKDSAKCGRVGKYALISGQALLDRWWLREVSPRTLDSQGCQWKVIKKSGTTFCGKPVWV